MILPQWVQDFFIETYNRTKARSPKFFQRLRGIAAVIVAIGFIPGLTDWLITHLPRGLVNTFRDIAIWASGVFTTSFLANSNKPIAMTKDGTVLVKPEVPMDKMPYTTSAELKEARKEGGILNPETPKETEIITKVKTD